VAVESGVGRILHFGCEIMARASEKVLGVRERWATDNDETLRALIRALKQASGFIDAADNRPAVAAAVARRLGVDADLVVRTLAGNLKIAPDGTTRTNNRYILIGRGAASRPDPIQAAWLYAQMVRWGQAPLSAELNATAQAVFRPDLYDTALGAAPSPDDGGPRDGIGGFIGPAFDAGDIAGHLAAWRVKRPGRPRLSVVR
jgi:NitT/TauT family transport system ATP-binding protein